ncbi:uncharacterized protein V6R79_002921 [Siganus canaliculatus]
MRLRLRSHALSTDLGNNAQCHVQLLKCPSQVTSISTSLKVHSVGTFENYIPYYLLRAADGNKGTEGRSRAPPSLRTSKYYNFNQLSLLETAAVEDEHGFSTTIICRGAKREIRFSATVEKGSFGQRHQPVKSAWCREADLFPSLRANAELSTEMIGE